jgi:uncharacterized membrane protein
MSASIVRRDWRWVWVPIGLVLGVAGIVTAVAALYGLGVIPRPTPAPWFPFFGFWVFFGFLAFFWVVRWLVWPWGWGYRGRYARVPWHGDTAFEIARARFARGEITKEQFDQLAWDLDASDRGRY